MKGRIFTAQEVQAIIAGNKTMFREVIKLSKEGYFINHVVQVAYKPEKLQIYPLEGCAPYQKGQKIFVKESFNIFAGQVAYKQSLANAEKYIWKPAQHMKQEHSRLTLQIKEIRVDKLINIKEDEVLAEGYNNKQQFLSSWTRKNKILDAWVWVVEFQKA